MHVTRVVLGTALALGVAATGAVTTRAEAQQKISRHAKYRRAEGQRRSYCLTRRRNAVRQCG